MPRPASVPPLPLDADLAGPLEQQLTTPTVLEVALRDSGDSELVGRAANMEEQLAAALAEVQGLPMGSAAHAKAASIAYELGHWYERLLFDEARAVRAYGQALALDPSLRVNLWAIRGLFYRRSLWPNLDKLIEAELGHAQDDSDRAELWLERATIYARQQQLAAAVAATDRACELDRDNPAPLLFLERLLLGVGLDEPAQWLSGVTPRERLLDVYKQFAQLAHAPARRSATWLRIAELAAPVDWPRAEAALARARDLIPHADNALVVAAAEVRIMRLRADAAHAQPAHAAALERLGNVYAAQLGAAVTDTATAPAPTEREQALRDEIAALWRNAAAKIRATEPERAWALLTRAAQLNGTDPLVNADRTELAETLGHFEALADLVAPDAETEQRAGQTMRRAEALLRSGAVDEAAAVAAELTRRLPDSLPVAILHERIALARGDMFAMAMALRRIGELIAVDSASASAAMFCAAAALCEDVSIARDLLGKAIELRPSFAPAWQQLVDFEVTHGNHIEALHRLGFGRAPSNPGLACPWSFEERYRRALAIAMTAGDLVAAAEIETAWLVQRPDDVAARWRLDALCLATGRVYDRIHALLEIARREPAPGRAALAYGEAAVELQRAIAGAAEPEANELRRALIDALYQLNTHAPDDDAAHVVLLAALFDQEEYLGISDVSLQRARRCSDGAEARRAFMLALLGASAAGQAGGGRRQAIVAEWLGRMPDDDVAHAEAAWLASERGDWGSAAEAWRVVADLQIGAGDARQHALLASFLFADASERAGRNALAHEGYRKLAEHAGAEHASAIVAVAQLALAETPQASQPGRNADPDTVLQQFANVGPFAAELAERNAWQALASGAAPAAQEWFTRARAAAPDRNGPLLGQALAAGVAGTPHSTGPALQTLARRIGEPQVASALHLRAAANAIASGQLSTARIEVAAGRLVNGANLLAVRLAAHLHAVAFTEALASRVPVGQVAACAEDAARAFAAVAGNAMGGEHCMWAFEQAVALAAAGAHRDAARVLVNLLSLHPAHIGALTLLGALARRNGQWRVAADTAAALGDALEDVTNRLAAWREAVALYDGENATARDPERAIACYLRILSLAPGADEFTPLLRLVRASRELRLADEILARRIAWAETAHVDNHTLAQLWWERALVAGEPGTTVERARALVCLENVLHYEPFHPEACWQRGELARADSELAITYTLWRRAIAHGPAPMARERQLTLVKMLEHEAGDDTAALDALCDVARAHPEDVPLHERTLALAERVAAWEIAVEELAILAPLRSDKTRAAADFTKLANYAREKLGAHDRANAALAEAFARDPLNVGLAQALREHAPQATRVTLAHDLQARLIAASSVEPPREARFRELAQVAEWTQDNDLRLLAEQVAATLPAWGAGFAGEAQPSAHANGPAWPNVAATSWQRDFAPALGATFLRSAEGMICRDVWRALAAVIAEAQQYTIARFGFARGDRIAQKKLPLRFAPLAAICTHLGITEADLYVSETRLGTARAWLEDAPLWLLGADIAAAHTASQRYALAHSLYLGAHGAAALEEISDAEMNLLVIAALRAVDVVPPSELTLHAPKSEALLQERLKLMKKLGRRERNLLAGLGTKAMALAELGQYRAAVQCEAARFATMIAGDIATCTSAAPPAVRRELPTWYVSDAHRAARIKLDFAGGARL